MSLRAALTRQLDPKARSRPGLSALNRCIVALILASTALVVLETEPAVSAGREGLLRAVELGFALLFALEYAARVWCAGEDPRYRGMIGRLRWAMTPMALVDLLALASLTAPLAEGNGVVLRLLRLARVLRLARLGRFSIAGEALSEALRARRYELAVTSAAALVLLLLSSTLLYLVESGVQPDAFGSIPRAMWWSVATLTTVGYGDIYPVTALGRVLAAATAVVGIGLIAMPTGILAAAFSDTLQRRRDAGEPPRE
ncbi:potassium channel family protein [Salinarimonas chemoclinalis]|uniref:potassium channel family protein n=1 Tax=Salinarimonas chemoclinalis TaxID=3241599 RepID=UPI0035573F93